MGPSFVGSVMKIAKIEVFQVDLPYAGGVYVLSGGREYRSFDATFVRVTTDYGLQGWGESTPLVRTILPRTPWVFAVALKKLRPC